MRAEEPGVPWWYIFNVAYLAGDEQLNNVRGADLKASVTLNPYVTQPAQLALNAAAGKTTIVIRCCSRAASFIRLVVHRPFSR